MGKKSRAKKPMPRPAQRARTTTTVPRPARQDGANQNANATGEVPPALAGRPLQAVSIATRPEIRRPKMVAVKDRPVDTSATLTTHRPDRGQGCAALAELEPRGLAATYTFDAPVATGPSRVAIRFSGARNGVVGKPGPRDRFEKIERVDAIPATGGLVAITARVRGINAGDWRVAAAPVEQPAGVRLPLRSMATSTQVALLAFGPGVRLASWPVLVGLGALVALVLQTWLLARAGMAVMPVLGVSLAACMLGYAGAKAYYLVLHRQHPRHFLTAGACIQGFLIVAFAVVALGAWSLRLPLGLLLDVTAPGVFLAMAIGRPGCFLTGCCAGRPTGSRWGLWSSDRRLAIRRFPVQLVEAVVTLVIGVAALMLVLTVEPPIQGLVFAGAVAAYTFARQLLFPLRADTHTTLGRVATMVLSGLALIVSVVLAVAG